MTALIVFWLLAGTAAGAAHVWMLWRASQPPFLGASWHWTRLLLTGGVLVTSAVLDGLLPAAVGYGLAYFATVGIVAIRTRT